MNKGCILSCWPNFRSAPAFRVPAGYQNHLPAHPLVQVKNENAACDNCLLFSPRVSPIDLKIKIKAALFIQSEWISGAQGLVYQARRASKVCSCRVFVSQASVFYVLTTWCAQASIRASGGTCRARDLSQCGYGFLRVALEGQGRSVGFFILFQWVCRKPSPRRL